MRGNGPAGFIVFLALSLLLMPSVISESLSLEIGGKCGEYNVTIDILGFVPACYDVKVDVTTSEGRVGEIFDPREGWKSSFFYIKEGICLHSENDSRTYTLRTGDTEEVLNFRGYLRNDSKTWETGFYEIRQDCPGGIPEGADYGFWIAVLVTVMVIMAGIVWQAKATRGGQKGSK